MVGQAEQSGGNATGQTNLFIFCKAWASVDHLKDHLLQPYVVAFLAERLRYLAEDMQT